MAASLADKIMALTGFDANLTSNIEGTNQSDHDEVAAQWMTDAARDVINILPPSLKMKCTKTTVLNNSTTTMDMDNGDVIFVTRLSANSGGHHVSCREINPIYGGQASDSSSIYYATVTDPVYWIDSNTAQTADNDSNAAALVVKPTPEATQVAHVHHINYPIFTAGDTETYDILQKTIIANFPDEAEHLVVLRASIYASQYLLAIEEDIELYMPILSTLKSQYQEGVLALKSGDIVQPEKRQGTR